MGTPGCAAVYRGYGSRIQISTRRYCCLRADHRSLGRLRIAPNGTGESEPSRPHPHFRGRLRRHSIDGCRATGLGTIGFRAQGAPWPVPWAFGTQNTTVAFLFSRVLVAGSGPRVDGTNNKVHWVAKAEYPTGYINVEIEGRPLGESQPILTFTNAGGLANLPKPGCWTFHLSWSAHSQQQVSIINLEVLPAGSLPG